jgi:hypothetical protein
MTNENTGYSSVNLIKRHQSFSVLYTEEYALFILFLSGTLQITFFVCQKFFFNVAQIYMIF